MCIIAIKKEGVNMPSKETIERMFNKNSDGAGYMIKRKRSNLVSIRKGLMTLNDFNKAIAKEKIKTSDIVVMHFRITTAGNTSKKMCHPFVADINPEVNQVLRAKTDALCYAHNGTIRDYANHEEYSDTAILGMKILSDKLIRDGLYNSTINDLIECRLDSSRLAVIDPREHEVHIFGEWDKSGTSYKWNEDKESGMVYSNYGWEEPKTYNTSTYGYGSYGYGGYGGYGSGYIPKKAKKDKNKHQAVGAATTSLQEKLDKDEDNYGMNIFEIKKIFTDDLMCYTQEEEEEIMTYMGFEAFSSLLMGIASGNFNVKQYYVLKYQWEEKVYGTASDSTQNVFDEINDLENGEGEADVEK